MVETQAELVIERTFDAPREKMWQAWTDGEKQRSWWGPKTYTAPSVTIDLRVGGKYLGVMRSPEGRDYWSTGVYRKIEPMSYLEMTDSFADEKGNVVSVAYYGMESDYPMELLVQVTFEDVGRQTHMKLKHIGFPAGELLEQCKIAWGESFDKLADILKKSS